MKTAPLDIALQMSALNEIVNQKVTSASGLGRENRVPQHALGKKIKLRQARVMMFFKSRKTDSG